MEAQNERRGIRNQQMTKEDGKENTIYYQTSKMKRQQGDY